MEMERIESWIKRGNAGMFATPKTSLILFTVFLFFSYIYFSLKKYAQEFVYRGKGRKGGNEREGKRWGRSGWGMARREGRKERERDGEEGVGGWREGRERERGRGVRKKG